MIFGFIPLPHLGDPGRVFSESLRVELRAEERKSVGTRMNYDRKIGFPTGGIVHDVWRIRSQEGGGSATLYKSHRPGISHDMVDFPAGALLCYRTLLYLPYHATKVINWEKSWGSSSVVFLPPIHHSLLLLLCPSLPPYPPPRRLREEETHLYIDYHRTALLLTSSP